MDCFLLKCHMILSETHFTFKEHFEIVNPYSTVSNRSKVAKVLKRKNDYRNALLFAIKQ